MTRGLLIKAPIKWFVGVSRTATLSFGYLLETWPTLYGFAKCLITCRRNSILHAGTQVCPVNLVLSFLLECLVVILNELIEKSYSSIIQPCTAVTQIGHGDQADIAIPIFCFCGPIGGDPPLKSSKRNSGSIN